MIGQRHMHLEVELLKWIAAIILSGALALLLASQAMGDEMAGDEMDVQGELPGLLPADMEQWAEPMRETIVPRGVLTEPGAAGKSELWSELWEETPGEDALAQWNARLWMILDLHRQGLVEEAIEAWAEMPLPAESEVWRYVALASAYLQSGDLLDAVAALDAAESLQPDNPVLHYYVGILRMQQAADAPQWYDAERERPIRLVSRVPRDIAPNSPSMYELAAMTSLQRSLDLAPYLQQNQLLIGSAREDYSASSPAQMPPMIHDLLVAIGADNFEGKAHNMLGSLSLQRGWLDAAEEHMDEAVATGLSVLYGYGDLGERYAIDERHLDAARCQLKQLAQGGPVVQPATKFYDNLRKALIDLF